MTEHKWYILNVIAGQEQKIASDIKLLIQTSLTQYVEEVLVPCKKIIKIKRGQKVQEDQKLFPGYVFIKANLHSNAYNIINAIPKVVGFLGSKNNPKPVAEQKMSDILALINNENIESGKKQTFEIGEAVKIIEGSFKSLSGTVEEFDAEKQRLKISVPIFGRATLVELDLTQVEKIN